MAPNQTTSRPDEVSIARYLPALVVFLVAIIVVPVLEIMSGRPLEAFQSVSWERDKVLEGESTKAFEVALEEKSLFAEKARPLQAEFLFRAFKEVTPKVLVGPDNWLFQASAAENFPRRGKEDLVQRHADAIVGMVRFLEARGIQVILVPVPVKWALYPEQLPCLARLPRSVVPELVARFQAEKVQTLDLIEEFKKVDFLSYVPNDTHFSPEASDHVAQLVAARLQRLFPTGIPGVPIALEVVVQAESRHEGDLQRMLGFRVESAAYQSLYVPERLSEIVSKATGKEYRSRSQGPIVWCGTSYSDVGNLAERLSCSLSREVEDAAVPGQGPTVRLLELVNDVLAGKRDAPRAIVWEFPEKHVFVRVDSFLRPLDDFLLGTARGDDIEIYEPQPLDYVDVSPVNVTLTQESDGAISGVATSGDPHMVFKLNTPIAPKPNQVLVYHVTSTKKTTSKVMYDFGSGLTRDDSLKVAIPASSQPTRVVIPLPDRPVYRLRIDPVDAKADFLLGPVMIASTLKP